MDNKDLKCAVYTRKSHEVGDNQFTSLDAQREAAENFIASQKLNGWRLLPERYDDGGFSGANTERPALKRLLADVESGRIDVVVIYKFDRLSRSLLDFVKLVEFFETHNASLVSITQQINTSTSAGRMMLNILITFSEFEREIIIERIRDRVAGAKRRGMYCGGPPILGYDADSDSKKLVVNKKEARIVKFIFRCYAEFASARKVAKLANEKGFRAKAWTSKKGKAHGGGMLTPQMVQRTLRNNIYTGMVHHQGKFYEGEHDAIIAPKLWRAVQDAMDKNISNKSGEKKSIDSPFKGLLKCGFCGGAMGITYTQKKNLRYTYYVCIKDKKRSESVCPLVRVPTGETDRLILERLSSIFRAPTLLAKICEAGQVEDNEKERELLKRLKGMAKRRDGLRKKIANGGDKNLSDFVDEFRTVESEMEAVESELEILNANRLDCREISGALKSLDELWDELFPVERYRLARLLIDKIIVTKESLRMEIKTHGAASLARELQIQDEKQVHVCSSDYKSVIVDLPMTIKSRSGRKIMIIHDPEKDAGEPPVKDLMARSLARSYEYFEMLQKGRATNLSALARKLNLDKSYLGKVLRMVNLAPDIQEAILNGNEPEGLSMHKLSSSIPDDWEEQRKLFKFKREGI
jgi:site-specific DNA recombinase